MMGWFSCSFGCWYVLSLKLLSCLLLLAAYKWWAFTHALAFNCLRSRLFSCLPVQFSRVFYSKAACCHFLGHAGLMAVVMWSYPLWLSLFTIDTQFRYLPDRRPLVLSILFCGIVFSLIIFFFCVPNRPWWNHTLERSLCLCSGYKSMALKPEQPRKEQTALMIEAAWVASSGAMSAAHTGSPHQATEWGLTGRLGRKIALCRMSLPLMKLSHACYWVIWRTYI